MAIKSLHILWQEAAKNLPQPSNGMFYTQKEYEANKGKINILSGHVHKITKIINNN